MEKRKRFLKFYQADRSNCDMSPYFNTSTRHYNFDFCKILINDSRDLKFDVIGKYRHLIRCFKKI